MSYGAQKLELDWLFLWWAYINIYRHLHCGYNYSILWWVCEERKDIIL